MDNANRGAYQVAFEAHGESPKALRWQSYKSIARRYRVLASDLNIKGKLILDVGCGMGDLLPYLYAKSVDFDYLGVDITKKFVEIAKKRYAGHDFMVADPFSENLEQEFDIVITCGTLNSNTPNWLKDRFSKIQRLFDLSNEVLVFNMAGGFGQLPENKKIAYANARDVLDFCAQLTPKIILKTHYHPKDFTIVMFK